MSDNKQSIGKIEPKRIMAYPLNEDVPFQYELCKCLHCKAEYLSQCDIDSEAMFCPLHPNHSFCVMCENTFDKSELKVDYYDGELYCKNCYCPKCMECGECVEDVDTATLDKVKSGRGSIFCSQTCYNQYFEDMNDND